MLIPAAGSGAHSERSVAPPAAPRSSPSQVIRPQGVLSPESRPAAAARPIAQRPAPARTTATTATAVAAPPAITKAAPPARKSAAQSGKLSPEQIRQRIFGGFRGESIEPVETTLAYKIGILLTAAVMIVLPVVYVAIIGLVCLATWWHLTHSYVIVGAVRGKAMVMALIVYLAPLLIGGIVIVFMFKPLFARPAKEGRRRSLSATSDPLLFEFVERICDLVGAAVPRRIDVDCDINASASFRRGLLSLVLGRDLVLTIGMPLAAGLSLQQFAGVLAHEFGHFSQGAGMRLTYITRSINMWFVRVVYERDAWDQWLESAGDGMDIRIGWVILVARGCVWLTRRILWVLMYAGHLVAGFMLRQMEYDADTYEARVAGSASFAATSRQLRLLGFAWQGAQHDLGAFYRDGRLVDDMPRLLISNLKQLPPEAQEVVGKLVAETTTGWFDSHPADKDRIAAAASEAAPGVFHSDLPARVLFSSFDATSKGVTWDYYCAVFGKIVDPKSLHSTEAMLARSDAELSAAKARDRFFAGAFTVLRPLRLPIMNAEKTNVSVWQDELAEARQTMETLAPECREAVTALDKADTSLFESHQARAVLSTGVALQAANFQTVYRSKNDATRARDAATAEIGRLDSRLDAYEDAAGYRLQAAIKMLYDPTVAGRMENGAHLQRESHRLWQLVSQISTLHGSILELRNTNGTLAALLGHIEGNERNETLVREVLDYVSRVRKQMSDLKSLFERVDYPFDHAEGQMSVSSFLIKVVPLEGQIGAVFEAANEVVGKLLDMYARATSRLCAIAEAVEADQGYQPLAAATGEVAV
jgi:hypothetical protein